MADNIKEFFDRFVEDFSSFDGTLIASRYMAPYIAMSPVGDAWQCSSRPELVIYFQSLLDKHSGEGVVRCEHKDLESMVVGNRCFFASVTWSMLDAEDKVVSTWRESYNLVNTDEGLRIFTSIDH